MANINAPYGFRQVGTVDGFTPNYAPSQRRILNTNATAIFKGDVVVQLGTGYITVATPGTTQISGIFDGCEYLSVSQGRTVRSPFWPGSDAALDVAAFVIDSPNSVFQVQSGNGGPVVLANVGANINFNAGSGGNTSNGFSGQFADFATIAVTATLPFRIINFAGNSGYVTGDGPPAIVGNGSDGTTAFNTIYVTFNNQGYKSTTGI
jgi:hypothetical protein